MVHEGGVVTVGQWDLPVGELVLQAAVEETQQELVGQTGRTVRLLLMLHCYWQKGGDTNNTCASKKMSVKVTPNFVSLFHG